MSEAKLIMVTGIMAAGKSTIAQGLAEQFPKGVHLRGDQFRRAIVSGRHDMSPDPTMEALNQLRLRHELAVNAAETYVRAGFTTVLQDTIIGPMLNEVVSLVTIRPFALIVLAPNHAEVERREHGRHKTGYTSFTPSQLDLILRKETAQIGYWLDSSALTIEETVQDVLSACADQALIH